MAKLPSQISVAIDTMRIENSVELDCGLNDTEIILEPSMSSSPISWSCMIPDDETAGG